MKRSKNDDEIHLYWYYNLQFTLVEKTSFTWFWCNRLSKKVASMRLTTNQIAFIAHHLLVVVLELLWFMKFFLVDTKNQWLKSHLKTFANSINFSVANHGYFVKILCVLNTESFWAIFIFSWLWTGRYYNFPLSFSLLF